MSVSPLLPCKQIFQCKFSRFCICVRIWYLSFSFGLTLFCIIGSRFIHLIRTDSDAFFFMTEFIFYVYHNIFTHSSVDGHLGCFHVLAIVYSAAKNNGIHVSVPIFISSGYMPRRGIAGSYGGFIPSFQGISIPSSVVATSIYIPTNSARMFPFHHTLPRIYCL